MGFRELVERVVKSDESHGGCPTCTLDRSGYVPSRIVSGSKVAVIGEAPGANEVEQQTPFVGQSGQVLRKALREEGIDPELVSFLNVVRCRPPKNRTPTDKEIALCGKKNLLPELNALSPSVVLLAGAVPFGFFFKSSEVDESRGNFRVQGGRGFMTLFHPAYVLHQGGLESKEGRKIFGAIRHDLSKVRRFVDGSLFSGREYTTVQTKEDARKWVDVLKKIEILGVDIEAISLRPWKPESKVLMISFAYDHLKSVCFPLFHSEVTDGEFRSVSEECVKSILSSSNTKVFHHAKYDVPYLEYLGYKVSGRICCTVLIAYLLDESRRTYGLKALVAQKLDGYRDLVKDFVNTSLVKMSYYNCEDSDNCRRLFFEFSKDMDEGLWNAHDKLLIPGSMELAEAEAAGMFVDLPMLKVVRGVIQTEVDGLISKINRAFPVGKTCTSDKDLSEFLFDQLGYTPRKSTKTGRRSVDKEVLQQLAEDDCEIARTMLRIRSDSKMLSTYLESYPSLVDPVDGKIHCSFMMHRTVTGRLASEDPNLQNIPRGELIRQLIVAPPGWKLIYGDLSQAELRVGGSLAHEPTLIEGYKKGLDAHRLTASTVVEIPMEKVTKAQRQAAKSVNFGLMFRMSTDGLKSYAKASYGVDMSYAQADEWREKWLKKYRFQEWWKEIDEFLHKNGFVRTVFGRIRRLPNVYSSDKSLVREAERMATNDLVQSPTSDCCLLALIQCQRKFRESKMRSRVVLTVHDSIMIRSPDEEVKEAAKTLYCAVQSLKFDWLKVPLVMDLEVGERWSDLKEIHLGKDF